jgi:5-methylcytosine-specific restriction endonuclease McrA
MSTILQRPTLVLNRYWQPVNVATVQKALVLLARDAARVVDPEHFQLYNWDDWIRQPPRGDEPAIRGVTLRLRVPEVVTLTHYERTPAGHVTFSKRNVFKRDRLTCQYCGIQPGRDELTLDHVTPKSRGGATSWENCVLACLECNRRKADRTPEQAGMKLRRRPARPTWKPFYAGSGRLASWTPFLGEAPEPLALVS